MAKVPVELAQIRRRKGPGRARPPTLGKRGVDILAGVPLFSGLSTRHLRRVAGIAEEVRFEPGEPIVEAGMLGETFYVVLEGEAKVVRGKRILNRLYPGDFFGEISLLDGGPRSASVIAVTPLVAVRLFRHHFVKLVADDPSISVKILQALAARLRNAQRPSSG